MILKRFDCFLCIALRTSHNDFKQFTHSNSTHFWGRRLDCFDTHHLEFRFFVLNTFRVMYVQNVTLLSSPHTLISNNLTFHDHLLSICIHMNSHIVICFGNHWFELILDHLVNDINHFLDWLSI